MSLIHYLGPEGSFTHAAALENRQRFADLIGTSVDLVAERTADQVFHAVAGPADFGLLALENNVEGYVVPNLDALIDADDVVGVDRVGLPVLFDAFARPDHVGLTQVVAHPHGLAQCRAFIEQGGYEPVPATSNAAACRGLLPHQIGLGPRVCGQLYDLQTVREGVQDYQAARTEFLLLASREQARACLSRLRRAQGCRFETVLVFVPLDTGPGVLAGALDLLRDAGLNMTSFISRPIKGHDGTYSFIVTLDAAPWEPRATQAVARLLAQGDWVRALAVYERPERPSPPVETWMLPAGGVRSAADPAAGRELLWDSAVVDEEGV